MKYTFSNFLNKPVSPVSGSVGKHKSNIYLNFQISGRYNRGEIQMGHNLTTRHKYQSLIDFRSSFNFYKNLSTKYLAKLKRCLESCWKSQRHNITPVYKLIAGFFKRKLSDTLDFSISERVWKGGAGHVHDLCNTLYIYVLYICNIIYSHQLPKFDLLQ